MSKIIIGIHGLANKPHQDILEDWWNKSIVEGLNVNEDIQDMNLNFQMVYWADLLYKNRLHMDETYSFDDLYNHEPYVAAEDGALKRYKDTWRDELMARALGLVGTTVDSLKQNFGVNSLADWILGKLLKDLAFYYDESRLLKENDGQPAPAKIVLRDRLKKVLLSLRDTEIMLIAHSMGSIIAYDVLRDLGRENSGIKISHFVTIGSPLGLPHVKGKILEERDYASEVRTPTIVTESWVNYADRKDPVAVDVHLRDDYKPNANDIRVVDDLVLNDYQRPGEDKQNNHHKSYGYLRTPEISEHIRKYLEVNT